MILISILLIGCVDSNIDNEKQDDLNLDYKSKIVGTWRKNDTFDNFTYKIQYKFNNNNDFISGVLNDDLITYNVSINGTYEIDNETLKFIVNDDDLIISTHKYIISDDNDFLLIYYEDEINYDVYSRYNS
jgi:hypothetical protein